MSVVSKNVDHLFIIWCRLAVFLGSSFAQFKRNFETGVFKRGTSGVGREVKKSMLMT